MADPDGALLFASGVTRTPPTLVALPTPLLTKRLEDFAGIE
jgi:hypothetical protein